MSQHLLIDTGRASEPASIRRLPALQCRFQLALSLAAVLLVAYLIDVAPLSFAVAAGSLWLGGWWLVGAVFRPRLLVDQILLTWTVAVAALGIVAEVLSAFTLMGSPTAWYLGAAAVALVGRLYAPTAAKPGRGLRLPPLPGLHWTGKLLLATFALQAATAFFLTWFTSVVIYDSLTAYMPRAIAMLQHGTLNVYATNLVDHLQYLHEVMVAFTLLFLQSDVLVNVLSFVTAIFIALGLYAFVSSLRLGGFLPLVGALLPFTMPSFLMHASASNFDIFEAQWLLFTLYFLRRAYAATHVRWLAAAALALGLALATKPTFYFAAPGLALLLLFVALRAIRRRRLGRLLRAVAIGGVLFMVTGTPFLIRNELIKGYLLAPPTDLDYFTRQSSNPLAERGRLLLFNSLALGTELLLPPFLLPESVNLQANNDWFAATAQAVGLRLPDPSLSVHADWPGLIHHGIERYNSGHASFGAAVVLVVLPSLLALPFARRQLGPYLEFALAAWLLAFAYFIVLGMLTPYTISNIRYLIEPAVLVSAVAPILFFALPRRAGAVLAIALAIPLLIEMNQVLRNNRQMPPALVMQTPREEQYYTFFGAGLGLPTAEAFRTLDRQYPAWLYPHVYVHDTGSPNFPLYLLTGPKLERRWTFWKLPQPFAAPPGPFLTQYEAVADAFRKLPAVTAVPLSSTMWLVIPNEQVKGILYTTRTDQNGVIILSLRTVATKSYPNPPLFRFVQTLPTGDTVLRDDAPDPTFDVPLEVAKRGLIRAEVRETPGESASETLLLDPRTYMIR